MTRDGEMSAIQCLKKSSFQICDKFTGRKLVKFLKVVKPVLKLMRTQRTNVVTPSACNYDVVESFQNDLNESELFKLDFKFLDGDEADENLRNEELERRLLEKLGSDEEEDAGGMALSQCCRSGCFRPDVDIYSRGDDYVTNRQTAEQQIPVAVI